MNFQELDAVMRQRCERPGFSTQGGQLVVVPYFGDCGAQAGVAYAASVTDAQGLHSVVVLGYGVNCATEASSVDDYFVQLGHPFLEGVQEQYQASLRCQQATATARLAKYSAADRLRTLRQDVMRAEQLALQVQNREVDIGDVLAEETQLKELEAVLGVAQTRVAQLNKTSSMDQTRSYDVPADRLAQAMLANYGRYLQATIAPFISTKSMPLSQHLHVQHFLSTVGDTDILVQLKRHHRWVQEYLTGRRSVL